MRIKDEFLKQSSVMFFAMALVNVSNLLYHLFMVRMLDTVDFGTLNSLFALLMIISVPAATIQSVVAKYVSQLQAYEDRFNKAGFLIRHLGVRIVVTAGIALLMIVAARFWISDFFKLPDAQYVIVLGLTLTSFIIFPLFQGGLQGFQKFGLMGCNLVVSSGLKLFLGIACVLLGYRVMGAFGAVFLSSYAQVLMAFIFLRHSFRRISDVSLVSTHSGERLADLGPSGNIDLKKLYIFFLPVALASVCFMMLTHSDILLVKHFFNPLDAGRYSVASMVGKMILFLPGALSIVMLPKSSKMHAEKRNPINLLYKSLFYSFILCGAAGTVFILFPVIPIKLLSVNEVGMFIPLSRLFVLSMGCFALLYVIIFYNISVHRMRFVYTLAFSLILQTLLICLFHKTLLQVISIVALNAFSLLCINLWIIKRRKI